ncbi:hypothetical protein [uncultured Zoogloea sp.]|uniref:hypothetical protein n=1 Tax=uncultured Zoogloea sp. TaxID=160237 RepID=UPI00263681BD|nr:hypothetical protein [uncultured Zoogloea sp.]
MKLNVALIFVFWTLPCLIYMAVPFGQTPDSHMKLVILVTNALLYIPCAYWIFLRKGKKATGCRLKYNININYIVFSQIVILFINLYIIQATSFSLGIVDDSVRLTIYETAGYLWSLLVALYSVSYAVAGAYVKLPGNKLGRIAKLMLVLNCVTFITYGMKSAVVQVALSYLAGGFVVRVPTINLQVATKLLSAILFILIGFWIVNSMRQQEAIDLLGFVELIYLYIAPNFTNYSNISSLNFDYEYFLGGVLGGLYKLFIPGYYAPLSLVSNDYLEYQTWNVWSYLTTFYVSGGMTEIVFGTFAIGVYTTYSIFLVYVKPSVTAAVNFSQMLLLLLFLHNQYYFSSFAPYAAIGIASISSRFIQKKS